jgi:two-component system cell cycle sensor histidine kinase/response regulator CckA
VGEDRAEAGSVRIVLIPARGGVMPNVSAMVVDDEEAVRRYLDRALRGAGISPRLAISGPEGVREACRLPHLDLLITDLSMPGMTGEDMVRQIRAVHPSLKVVYLSGDIERLARADNETEGAAALAKPCSPSHLQETIEQLLT